MRNRVSPLIVAAIAASLAAPAGALAQSAGDEQYTDPFSQSEPRADQQAQAPGNQSSSEPAAPGSGSGQAAPAAAPAQDAPAQLPRTGFALALTGSAGYALLLAGIAIRRRL
jgi:cell division protein FtsN